MYSLNIVEEFSRNVQNSESEVFSGLTQFCVVGSAGSGVSGSVREHPGHVGARPPHGVGRRHLREERLSEGNQRFHPRTADVSQPSL